VTAVDVEQVEGWTERWSDRIPSWLHTSEGGSNPARYSVAELAYGPARTFVVAHHYSGAFSSAVLRYGLVDLWTDQVVGVCVLGNSMGPHVLLSAFPSLRPSEQCLELSRLVLLDAVPANAESWFVAAALELAAARGVLGVVMYSDPNERITPHGKVMPGHLGTAGTSVSPGPDTRTTYPTVCCPSGPRRRYAAWNAGTAARSAA
jgi:hypothetical protein